MNTNFEIGQIITMDNEDFYEIICISKNNSDGLRFDIKSLTNNFLLEGCWLWDAEWKSINNCKLYLRNKKLNKLNERIKKIF